MRMRSAEWGTIESAECGMRNAELKGEVVPQDARPYIPHSAFHIPHWRAGRGWRG